MDSGACKLKVCTCNEAGKVPAQGIDCPTDQAEKCVATTTPGTTTPAVTTPAPLAKLTADAKKGDTKLEVDTNGELGVGDTIILNLGGATEETLTVDGFGSILLKEPLENDHSAGETITMGVKAEAPVGVDDGANSAGGGGQGGTGDGATAAIVVVIVVVILLVAGGGIATFFILKSCRQSANAGTAMKIGPRGNKAITIASTDDMNSPTY